jgi:hypothetical protein
LVHKLGVKPVSEQRLLRRKAVYYYRRRVPLHLVNKIGKKVIQLSLQTTSLKEAKKRRTLCDLQWDARFDAYSNSSPDNENLQTSAVSHPVSQSELVQLVRDYVERQGRRAEQQAVAPDNAAERAEMKMEEEFVAQTLRVPENQQTQEWVYHAGNDVLEAVGKSFDDPDVPGEALAELVRRGLLELNRRRLARLADDHSRSFFDQLFDPGRERRRNHPCWVEGRSGSTYSILPISGHAASTGAGKRINTDAPSVLECFQRRGFRSLGVLASWCAAARRAVPRVGSMW